MLMTSAQCSSLCPQSSHLPLDHLSSLPQTHGTKVDDKKLAGHAPTPVKDGTSIQFGASGKRYIVRCSASGGSAGP